MPITMELQVIINCLVNDEISYDKEFLIQDHDGYLLRFND